MVGYNTIAALATCLIAALAKSNVLVIMTDDQGMSASSASEPHKSYFCQIFSSIRCQ